HQEPYQYWGLVSLVLVVSVSAFTCQPHEEANWQTKYGNSDTDPHDNPARCKCANACNDKPDEHQHNESPSSRRVTVDWRFIVSWVIQNATVLIDFQFFSHIRH